MAKQKSKREWEEIRADFEKGISQADLRKKYDLSPSTLGTKIKRDGWRLSHEQHAVLSNFKEASAKISESFENATQMQKEELAIRIETILEDNKLIQNNRKLLVAVQSIIGQELRSNKINASNVKSITGAILDIEKVANPQASKQEINIQNTNAQQTNIKSLDDFYE